MSLRQQCRYRHRLLQRIARRSRVSDTSEIGTTLIAREIERYLGSHATQSAVRHEIGCRKYGAEDAGAHWREAQRSPVVPFDYRRSRNRPVIFCHKPRATSGLRKICSLPDTMKMWHVMAGDLIVAQHQPRLHIGDWPGRGRDWQMDQLLAALTSPGLRIMCVDIHRAFASVRPSVLYELPYLPEPLIRRMLDCRYQRFIRRERSEYARYVSLAARDMLEVAPSGLMEGSPASNAIFSVLFDNLADCLGEDVKLFVYCDNLIIVVPTIEDEWAAMRRLVRYLTGHRAGPLEARYSSGYLWEGFNHLGYRIVWNEVEGFKVGLSPANYRKLEARLDDENEDMDNIVDWLSTSFPHCSGDAWLREITGRPDRAA